MVDLKALKEQLRLLGHDLPDSQVINILREMNIDFTDITDGADEPSGTSENQAQGPARTGSILDNFAERKQARSGAADETASDPAGHLPVQPCGFQYEYTGPTNDRVFAQARSNAPALRSPEAPGASDLSSDGNDDEDADDAGESGVSCRYCTSSAHPHQPAMYGYTGGRADACGHTHAIQDLRPDPLAAPAAAERRSGPGALPSKHGTGNLTEQLARVRLGASTAHTAGPFSSRASDEIGVTEGAAVGPGMSKAPVALHHARPGSAVGARDQKYKQYGTRSPAAGGRLPADEHVDDNESDVAPYDSDKAPFGLGGSQQRMLRMPPQQAWMGSAAAGHVDAGAGDARSKGPYAGWLGRHDAPVDAYGAEHGHARGQLSPQASDRSVVSRTSTRCSNASKGRGKKVDRVQRYQQLQQEWNQNRFLKQSGGANRGTNRKPVNFHTHFASLHAAEEAERQRLLRETRTRTKKELGSATEAPTANRRDELRWQTRMRLKNQT